MTSDVDQKKLRVAIDWISKLANGTNPIDGSTLPDNDIVNNVHISRCLFFVSNLLEDIGKKKTSSKKQYELEFQFTPEIVSNVYDIICERMLKEAHELNYCNFKDNKCITSIKKEKNTNGFVFIYI